MPRRTSAATAGVVCPRCGMLAARIIGRSESLPVIYLQCEDCGRTSVAPSGEQA
jgi:ribosomal protein S27E